MTVSITIDPAEAANTVDRRLDRWQAHDVGRRIWERDPTVWFDPPRPEIADRLGWLDLPDPVTLAAIEAFTATVIADGIRDVVLLGMGGSSLSPRVYASVFPRRDGFPRLTVLDSTHPDAVGAVDELVDPTTTLFLVASKSGTTLETRSFFRYFWARTAGSVPEPANHFVALTDPGTPLETLAVDHGFRTVFHTPPDVGGRYSALTPFGLVPAGLHGVDLRSLVESVAAAHDACGPEVPVPDNPALRLGATMGTLARAGRDKLLFVMPARWNPLADWSEQLVAESLGKDDRGIVPVPRPLDAGAGPDRWLLTMDDAPRSPYARLEATAPADLGAAFFLLEMAVAAAGGALGVHPFDQPDVQAAKALALRAMDTGFGSLDVVEHPVDDPELPRTLGELLGGAAPPHYLGIHAYLAPSEETGRQLESLRELVEEATGMVTTVGYGPRFLHSTGQLHKGGVPTGIFLQIVDHPRTDRDIPGTDYSFGRIIAAQAAGDQAALRARGRPVAMVCLGDEGPAALPRLRTALAAALG